MDEPPPGRVQVEAILTTDQPMEAYGGIRIAVEALHQLAHQVVQPGVELFLNHDSTRPLNGKTLSAEVRWNERGWNEVFVVFEVDADPWAEFEAEKQALGVPGGMSFSTTAPLGSGGTGDRPVVKIGGDAHHFSPADLEDAGRHLLPMVDVELEALFQFSTEPPAKVFFEYAFEVLQAIPPNLLASLIYDALKGLIRKRRDAGGKTTVDFLVTETPGVRLTRGTVTTDSEAVALKAIEAWVELGAGSYRWDGDDGPFVST